MIALVSGTICALCYYAAMHGTYEREDGKQDGTFRCLRTAGIYGVVCAVFVWVLL